MDKEQVAEILAEIGTLLELKGENPFKTRAYVNAARTIESLRDVYKRQTTFSLCSAIFCLAHS